MKENTHKETPFDNAEANKWWNEWLYIRELKKKIVTPNIRQERLNELIKISTKNGVLNMDKLIAVVKRSAENNWLGFFDTDKAEQKFSGSKKILKGGEIINTTEDELERLRKKGLRVGFDKSKDCYYIS